MTGPVVTIPNPDLEVGYDNKARWNMPDHRRRGFHDLPRIARYGMTFRAARVMTLEKRMDLRIPELPEVERLTALPWFSAMVVIRGRHVLFERYAPDFGPDGLHQIQSINKTMVNLAIGRLVEEGRLDLARAVKEYLPEIGSGYAEATVQQVLDMDVANDYSEDFTDPGASYWTHEEAMGWRLPRDPAREETEKSFVVRVTSADVTNRLPHIQYKDTNTVVAGWIVERVGGRPWRAILADIADAAGIEGVLYTSCDRDGFPTLEGGVAISARDLARYAAIFVRRGMGVDGRAVGSGAFIEASLARGVPLAPPRQHLRYSNQLNTDGRWIGHGGYGGQYMLADLASGVIGVFFSVVEDKDGYPQEYYPPLIAMLAGIARLDG